MNSKSSLKTRSLELFYFLKKICDSLLFFLKCFEITLVFFYYNFIIHYHLKTVLHFKEKKTCPMVAKQQNCIYTQLENMY